ncbi:MAG: hypothetical protein NTW07_01835 [candidate division Zixibacteria bacterium]|nr:hypothetical protein [candidate division Zixibacteria bacterium]
MKLIAKTVVYLTLLAAMPLVVQAQQGQFGVPDTVYADIARIDDFTMTVTISYFNDENVVGLQIPFKMNAGLNKVVADSAVYTGGRITEAKWAYSGFRPDTAVQCVLLGMMANIGPTEYRLTPGNGRVATVYVSSIEKKKIEKLSIDTTTVGQGVSLLAVADNIQNGADTRLEVKDRHILPVWVVRHK